MNWNIFKRLRSLESASLSHAMQLSVLISRVDTLIDRISQLERKALIANTQASIATAKAVITKKTKEQEYRRKYYQKRKAAMAALKGTS